MAQTEFEKTENHKEPLSSEVYRDTRYFVSAMVKEFRLYPEIFDALSGGDASVKFRKRVMLRAIDESWVSAIEDTLIALDDVIRKPARFIEQTEEVLPIELTKSVSSLSIKHLSQHTDLISKVDGDDVLPSKLLNVFRDETVLTYENKFINTLLSRLYTFVSRRYQIAKRDGADSKSTSVEFNNTFEHDEIKAKMHFSLEIEERAVDGDVAQNYVYQSDLWKRVEKLYDVCNAYMQSSFVKEMGKNYIRPPVMRTNAILKNKNLRQCLNLWNFIEGYENSGYSTTVEDSLLDADEEYIRELYSTMAMEYLLFRYHMKEGFDEDNEINRLTSDMPLTPQIIEDLIPPSASELAFHFPSSDSEAGERTAEEAEILRSIEVALIADRLIQRRLRLEELSPRVRYNKSFTARLILAQEPSQTYYTRLKNFALSYRKVKSRISWRHELFAVGRKACMKLIMRGKTLIALFDFDVNDPELQKYRLEDMSEYSIHKALPAAIRIRSERALRYARELFAKVMQKYAVPLSDDAESKDYHMPHQTVGELIAMGHIKISETEDIDDTAEESGYEATVGDRAENSDGDKTDGWDDRAVRYSRSFLAKLILAQNPSQAYYTEIKNYLLSYSGVKSRVSWKHDSFFVGRFQVAKIKISGKTLLVCLPLNPKQFNKNKYHFYDMSAYTQYEKTPFVMRVRSDRALKYTMELINMVMGERNVPASSVTRQTVDYSMPLQTKKQLLLCGLIREKASGRQNRFIFNKKSFAQKSNTQEVQQTNELNSEELNADGLSDVYQHHIEGVSQKRETEAPINEAEPNTAAEVLSPTAEIVSESTADEPPSTEGVSQKRETEAPINGAEPNTAAEVLPPTGTKTDDVTAYRKTDSSDAKKSPVWSKLFRVLRNSKKQDLGNKDEKEDT